MKTPKRSAQVVPYRPNSAGLLKAIRILAAKSENVSFGKHARDRMQERGITDREALQVLRSGELKGDIVQGTNAGEWKCKIVAKIKGSRSIGVVTIYLEPVRLFVKTVEWEDL